MPKSLKMKTESASIASLMPHPRNYRKHPDDQIEHIKQSLLENNCYRAIVVSSDDYILAGHGVVMAAKELGYTEIPVVRLDVPHADARALKVLSGDNEIGRLGEVNDRMLTDMLKDISEHDTLVGTGFDEMMLANLAMITRTEKEMPDVSASSHWAGMPEYQEQGTTRRITVSFKNEEDVAAFAKRLGVVISEKTNALWFPPREHGEISSPSSVEFQ